ncbi:glycosyltransferase family 2 protein [Frateuria aurantia]
MLAEAPRIHAVVVAYRPDPPVLQALLERLLEQVERVWLVDNTPGGEGEAAQCLPMAVRGASGLRLLPLGVNRGIATGFNMGIRAALGEGASHVLLSDQDSLPGADMVAVLLAAEQRLLAEDISPAALGPGFSNTVNGQPFRFQVFSHGGWRCHEVMADDRHPLLEVGALISSGSLIRREVLATVGLMRDDFFIDYVDIEWCHRARAHGHPSYVCAAARLEHQLGERPLRVWAGRWRALAEHSPLRLYFQARNAIYLMRLGYIAPWYRWVQPRFLLGRIYAYGVFARQRRASLRMLARGVWDGLRGRLGGPPA